MSGPKVLYIAGPGRSGSTILDQILGEVPGFVSTGELQMIWQRGLVEGQSCGCSVSVRDCPFWRAVVDEAFGGMDADGARAVLALLDRYVPMSARRLARLRADTSRERRSHGRTSNALRYAQSLESLYRAIASVAGARVVVDSTKTVVGAAMAAATDLDVYVLHLVRDPRAVAHSWARNRRPGEVRRDPGGLEFARALSFSFEWTTRNLALELLQPAAGRRLKLRYEDLTSSPAACVAKICDFVGERLDANPVSAQGAVVLGENHMASGNRARYVRGEVVIRPDDEWRHSMSARTSLVGTLSALPLLRRYGYPLVPRA
jgi:hypothetical protein